MVASYANENMPKLIPKFKLIWVDHPLLGKIDPPRGESVFVVRKILQPLKLPQSSHPLPEPGTHAKARDLPLYPPE